VTTQPDGKFNELPSLFAGSQTTSSTIPAVTISGALALFPQHSTVADAPSTKLSFWAVAGLTRTTATLAVAAKYGSPLCREPLSSKWRQVERTA
jgi:hypothetical protein